MQYSSLIQEIEKQIEFEPKQADLCKILDITRATMSYRAKNNSEFSLEEISKIEKHYAINLNSGLNDNCVDIDYFENVYASCGLGAKVFDETTQKLTVPKSMIENYSKGHKYSVINSKGDSMTPYLQDGDKLVVEHWEGSQIVDNRIYVFSYDNEIFVKRLIKNVTQIVIKSDNPMYKPIEIDGKDKKFSIIGQIVGLLRDIR